MLEGSKMFDIIISITICVTVFFLGTLAGRQRNKDDIDTINKNLLLYNEYLMKKTDEVLVSFAEKSEVLHGKNMKLITKHNNSAIEAINNQVELINSVYFAIKDLKQSAEEQRELYGRIITLQKIILKKKGSSKSS